MAISTIATTDSPETGRTTINANFQDVLSAFGGSSTAFPKRYVAIIAQTGTNAPTATVLENTLGVTPTFGYTNVGIYTCTATGVLTANKTVITFNQQISISGNSLIQVRSGSIPNSFSFGTYDITNITSPALANDIFANFVLPTLIITVYP